MGMEWVAIVMVGLGMSAIESQSDDDEARLRAELWCTVSAGDLGRVRGLLDAAPWLASIRNEKEESAPLFALYHRRTEIAELLLSRKEAMESLDVFEAASFGRVERLKVLLDGDPGQVNAVAGDGFFPLGLAAFFGREEAVKALLARGADPNFTARNSMKVRALHAAVASRSVSVARLLIEAGADVDAPQEGGFTPLQEAASNGQLDLARLLLDHGASVDVRADDGRTALEMAREKNQEPMVELLAAGKSR